MSDAFAAKGSFPIYMPNALSGVGFSTTILEEFLLAHKLELGTPRFRAITAGTGSGNTVIDVLLNGTSIYVTAANRPTLLGTGTGLFTSIKPDGYVACQPGDYLTVQMVTAPATTTHARLIGSIPTRMRG